MQGRNVPERDSSFGIRLAMLRTDQTEQTADDGVIDAKPACVALVAMEEPVMRSKTLRRLTLPDPTFATHLIATREQVPQTRLHRRAAQADALSAYRAHLTSAPGIGFLTRQVA